MANYSGNMLTNGDASQGLTGWQSSGVSVVTPGNRSTHCFQLQPGFSMSQAAVRFAVSPPDVQVSFDYKQATAASDPKVYVAVYAIEYFADGSSQTVIVPAAIVASGQWNTVTTDVPIDSSKTLKSIALSLQDKGLQSVVQIGSLSIVRNMANEGGGPALGITAQTITVQNTFGKPALVGDPNPIGEDGIQAYDPNGVTFVLYNYYADIPIAEANVMIAGGAIGAEIAEAIECLPIAIPQMVTVNGQQMTAYGQIEVIVKGTPPASIVDGYITLKATCWGYISKQQTG